MAVLATGTAGYAAAAGPHPVGSVEFPVNLGDFVTTARLDHPAGPRAPLVLLIHGAGYQDRDATVTDENGQVTSHNFADIAAALSRRGFAVLRYDKHYVTGPDQATDRYASLTLRQMVTDARTVLDAALADPRTRRHVDPRQVYLYGWSEGSTVAAALAVTRPDLAGLVIQGGVNLPWRDGLLWQARRVAVPYLRRFAEHGLLTPPDLRRAWQAQAGRQAKEWSSFLIPGLASGDYSVEPAFDPNHDGAIDIDRELLPALPSFVDMLLGPDGPVARYGPGRALPTVLDQAGALRIPVLIMHGWQDGNVPAASAVDLDRALTSAGNADHTLRLYAGLGHSLGPADSVTGDRLLPIQPRPLADLVSWLRRRTRR